MPSRISAASRTCSPSLRTKLFCTAGMVVHHESRAETRVRARARSGAVAYTVAVIFAETTVYNRFPLRPPLATATAHRPACAVDDRTEVGSRRQRQAAVEARRPRGGQGFRGGRRGGRHEVDVCNRISIGRTTGAGDSLYNVGGNDALHFLPAILRHLYLIRPVSGRLCPSTVPLASIWPASGRLPELQPVPAVPAGGPGPGRPGTAGPDYKASPPGAPR